MPSRPCYSWSVLVDLWDRATTTQPPLSWSVALALAACVSKSAEREADAAYGGRRYAEAYAGYARLVGDNDPDIWAKAAAAAAAAGATRVVDATRDSSARSNCTIRVLIASTSSSVRPSRR